jgi:hypothetical protein
MEALRDRLDQAAAAIGGGSIFAEEIAERRDELLHEISEASALQGVGRDRTESNLFWNRLASSESSYATLFREVLAYLQAENRPAFPASGAAPLARGLIAEVCQQLHIGPPPVLAPDVEDSFSDRVQIIRLRFPPAGIWDVPVVAHELGHFMAYRLTGFQDGVQRRQLLRELISEYLAAKNISLEDRCGTRWRYTLNELFADAFATYCVGPAYAMSAVLLRFDVARARNDSDPKHPSYAARAAAILHILGEMNRQTKSPYTRVIEILESRWSKLLTFAEGRCQAEWVPEIAYKLYSLLNSAARDARYDAWDFADNDLQFVLTTPGARPERRASARDILNAAWIARASVDDATAGPSALKARLQKLADINARALDLWNNSTTAKAGA